MKLEKYSFGTGDRFGHQGQAQLKAILKAHEQGIAITPVWNKSHREHTTIGSQPQDVRREADMAVKALDYSGAYRVDADHINMSNIALFVESADFFTLDVADYIGQAAEKADLEAFMSQNEQFIGDLQIEGMPFPFEVTRELLQEIAKKFLYATQQAAKIYQYIAAKKGESQFITEVSMDEVDQAQTPVELFFILRSLSQLGVPAQTIAPKFTGRFNKGVDYVGDTALFAQEFEQDLLVIAHAIKAFNLPESLKLSVHSGSDKFSIYPIMGDLIRKHGAGLHVKTAGTTWLEEMIGLAEAGGQAYELAKSIYLKALAKIDELAKPYATVIDIDNSKLPQAGDLEQWRGTDFARALRHDPSCPDYNLHFRQLVHVAYKIAAQEGENYTNALKDNQAIIEKQVVENIYDRHIKRLFDL